MSVYVRITCLQILSMNGWSPESAGSADIVLFEVCGFYGRDFSKAADLHQTQVCATQGNDGKVG